MKKSYVILDIVRFLAAILVMFYHLTYHSWSGSVPGSPDAVIADDLRSLGVIFSVGWIGVPIFFVLSGFVIAFSADGKTCSEFIRSRILRLYPAAWICATVTALFALHEPALLPKYLSSIALLPIGPWIDPVYWTLAVEVAFYALIAVVLAVWGSHQLTRAGMILGVLSSTFWLARAADFALGHHFRSLFALFEGAVGNLFLLSHGCFFALGILVWSLTHKAFSTGKLVTVMLCGVAGLISTTASARFQLSKVDASGVGDLVAAPVIWAVSVCVIVLAAAWNLPDWRGSESAQRVARIIGLATFPVYLLHNVAGVEIMRLMSGAGSWFALTVTTILVLLSSLAVVAVEKHLRLLMVRFLPPARSASEVASRGYPA